MNQQKTKGIILSRTNYGEADRIINVLTPDQGKLTLMARGVRKVKSKLAGGIELFSVSDFTYIAGRGEIGALVSSRLIKHYGTIVKDIDRVQLGYKLIKLLNKVTEDHPEEAYFKLMDEAFEALDTAAISQTVIECWFNAQLLKHAGHSPNLSTDAAGDQLTAGKAYAFDDEAMAFVKHPGANFNDKTIKAMRLIFSSYSLQDLQKVTDLEASLKRISLTLDKMVKNHIS